MVAKIIDILPEQEETGETKSVTFEYRVIDTTSRAAALAALAAAAPDRLGNLHRTRVEVSSIDAIDIWAGEVTYTAKKPKEEGQSEYSFELGGGSQHITQSIKTVNKYASGGGEAPDHKGAIGVTSNGVTGVDINLPTFGFSETHYYNAETVTVDFVESIEKAVWKTNKSDWRNYKDGEVIFVGATGSFSVSEGEGIWQIAYRFMVSRNAKDLKVGDIENIVKRGWEYLWVQYEDVEDEDAKRLTKRPIAAYVEQVYEETDFSKLPIPQGPLG